MPQDTNWHKIIGTNCLEQENHIQSLPELALQYGTINQEQFKQIHQLSLQKQQKGESEDFSELLISQRFATSYQVGLLKLIQEYLILKKRGEAFGKIAVEKGFATKQDVQKALEQQRQEFKRARIKKMIGDILVESRVITVRQKSIILKEQTFLDSRADRIFSQESPEIITEPKPEQEKDTKLDKTVPLSAYEKQFLQTKVLDQEFAARVIEKKLASRREVSVAQKIQEDAFEEESKIRILGDIMVELNQITEDEKKQVLNEQNRLGIQEKRALDSGIRVLISQDQMEAKIEIGPDQDKITLKDLKSALEKKGVLYGIYPDAVLQCHLDMGNRSFIAARQDYTTALIKEKKVIYHFDTSRIDTEKKDKGATLAEQHLGSEAHVKKSVLGSNLEQKNGSVSGFRCGAGTRLSKDKTKVFAGKTGFPSLSIDKKLFIHPDINVLEDADLRYGALEKYANLNISGVLTGAYPVTAGEITAREIRGANINAIGNITARIGITDSFIQAQGDIHASYIHNAILFTFGNIYIENEIIDSKIYSSGMISAPGCRVIASDLFGKKGVELAGVGSERTRSCVVGAGTEHHLLEITKNIQSDIQSVRQELDDLTEEKQEHNRFASKTFQKMVELKIFHDRAKKKKQWLTEEFKLNKDSYSKRKLKNIATLVNNFQNRMEASLSALKELNEIKKGYEKKKRALEKNIAALTPKVQRKISKLETDQLAFYEWARKQDNFSDIKIHGSVCQGTLFKGVYSSMEMKQDRHSIFLCEKKVSENNFELVIQKKE